MDGHVGPQAQNGLAIRIRCETRWPELRTKSGKLGKSPGPRRTVIGRNQCSGSLVSGPAKMWVSSVPDRRPDSGIQYSGSRSPWCRRPGQPAVGHNPMVVDERKYQWNLTTQPWQCQRRAASVNCRGRERPNVNYGKIRHVTVYRTRPTYAQASWNNGHNWQ